MPTPHPDIPPDVKRFIADHIPSVERLEILLLLVDGRKHAWTAHDMEDQIRSSVESVTKNLQALVSAKLVASDINGGRTFRYRPGTAEIEATVTELALAYRTRRVAVTELIYANRGATNFSDSFRFGAP